MIRVCIGCTQCVGACPACGCVGNDTLGKLNKWKWNHIIFNIPFPFMSICISYIYDNLDTIVYSFVKYTEDPRI